MGTGQLPSITELPAQTGLAFRHRSVQPQDIEDRCLRSSRPEPAEMSKARLVITAVTVEKRPVSGVARAYGVARSWICALLDRYRAEGEAAFRALVTAAQDLTRGDQRPDPRTDHQAAQGAGGAATSDQFHRRSTCILIELRVTVSPLSDWPTGHAAGTLAAPEAVGLQPSYLRTFQWGNTP